MLVMTRKLGEKIMVGKDVVITVVQITQGKVRIGVEAPKEVPIHREELLIRYAQEKREEERKARECQEKHKASADIATDPSNG